MNRAEKFLDNLIKSKAEVLFPNEFSKVYSSVFNGKAKEVGLKSGFLGSSKIYDNKQKIRLLASYSVVPDRLLEFPVSYFELAKLRLYEALDYLKLKRFRYSNFSKNVIDNVIQPLYCKAGEYKNMVYLDISSCYQSIYSKFLNVKYSRGLYLSKAYDYSSFFKDLPKQSKTAVFGIMKANKVLTFNSKSVKAKRIVSYVFNPDLIVFTYDLLQALAYISVNLYGAVYVNTDGYILDVENAKLFAEFLNSLGFNVKVKGSGNAIVRAVGVYKVGNTETKNFKSIKYNRDKNNLYLTSDEVKWIINSVYKSVSNISEI